MMRKLLVAGIAATLAVTGSLTAFAYPLETNQSTETVRTNYLPRQIVKTRALGVYPGCEVFFGFDEFKDPQDTIDTDYDRDSALATQRGRTTYVSLTAPKYAGAYNVVAAVEDDCEYGAGDVSQSVINVGTKAKFEGLILTYAAKKFTIKGTLKTSGGTALGKVPVVVKIYKNSSLLATTTATTGTTGAISLVDSKTFVLKVSGVLVGGAGSYKVAVSMAPNATYFLERSSYESSVVTAQ